jgi:hypothetical protein
MSPILFAHQSTNLFAVSARLFVRGENLISAASRLIFHAQHGHLQGNIAACHSNMAQSSSK